MNEISKISYNFIRKFKLTYNFSNKIENVLGYIPKNPSIKYLKKETYQMASYQL